MVFESHIYHSGCWSIYLGRKLDELPGLLPLRLGGASAPPRWTPLHPSMTDSAGRHFQLFMCNTCMEGLCTGWGPPPFCFPSTTKHQPPFVVPFVVNEGPHSASGRCHIILLLSKFLKRTSHASAHASDRVLTTSAAGSPPSWCRCQDAAWVVVRYYLSVCCLWGVPLCMALASDRPSLALGAVRRGMSV